MDGAGSTLLVTRGSLRAPLHRLDHAELRKLAKVRVALLLGLVLVDLALGLAEAQRNVHAARDRGKGREALTVEVHVLTIVDEQLAASRVRAGGGERERARGVGHLHWVVLDLVRAPLLPVRWGSRHSPLADEARDYAVHVAFVVVVGIDEVKKAPAHDHWCEVAELGGRGGPDTLCADWCPLGMNLHHDLLQLGRAGVLDREDHKRHRANARVRRGVAIRAWCVGGADPGALIRLRSS